MKGKSKGGQGQKSKALTPTALFPLFPRAFLLPLLISLPGAETPAKNEVKAR
jgi:hypothetical protein